jgi:hypothetical protein
VGQIQASPCLLIGFSVSLCLCVFVVIFHHRAQRHGDPLRPFFADAKTDVLETLREKGGTMLRARSGNWTRPDSQTATRKRQSRNLSLQTSGCYAAEIEQFDTEAK